MIRPSETNATFSFPNDDLTMLDYFDADDNEISELLDMDETEFSDAVCVGLDLPNVEAKIKEDPTTTSLEELGQSTADSVDSTDSYGAKQDVVLPSKAAKYRGPIQSSQKHKSSRSGSGPDIYDDMLKNLAASMKRSEESRANVMMQRQHRSSSADSMMTYEQAISPVIAPQGRIMHTPRGPSLMTPSRQNVTPTATTSVPQLQSIVRLSGFLSGERTTLTSGLEQSRRQLKDYMSHMSYKTM